MNSLSMHLFRMKPLLKIDLGRGNGPRCGRVGECHRQLAQRELPGLPSQIAAIVLAGLLVGATLAQPVEIQTGRDRFAQVWSPRATLPVASKLPGGRNQQEPASEVVTLDGRRISARLVAVDGAWNLRLDTSDRQLVLSPEEIVRWGTIRDSATGPIILLNDGSRVVAELLAVERNLVRVGSRIWVPCEVPLAALAGIILQPPTNPLDRDRMVRDLLDSPSRRDRVVLRNGDVLEGLVLPTANADRSNDDPVASIRIQVSTRELEIPRDRIAAIQWGQIERGGGTPRGGRAWVCFQDGTLTACNRIEEQRDGLQLELACGVSLAQRTYRRGPGRWEQVVAVVPRNERITYLSDLEVAQYAHQPAWGKEWSYRLNANVLGGLLRSRRGIDLKGIGMHSASSMAFYLDGKYRRLQGDVALDHSAGEAGSVVFRVYVTNDGREWQTAFESPLMRGDSPPLPVDIPVAGALAVTLEVGYADRGDTLDRANWLELRLLR
jgi:hypothetical protein